MTTDIGAHYAQSLLPKLLREVEAGERFTITDRGAAIAAMVPCEAASKNRPQPITTA